MVDFTPTNKQAAAESSDAVTTQQPRSAVTAQDIAQPYADLSAALTKSGEALETLAEEQAKEAGYKAVTKDADGNIQVQKMPIFGPASQEYARAVKVSALAQGEQDAKRQIIKMRQDFRDDPESFLTAADTFNKSKVKQYTDAAGPEVGLNLGKAIDAATTQTYQGLQSEHERLTLQRSEATITAGINSAKDDAVALARGGDTSSPAFIQAVSKVQTLTNEKVANPRLAYPKEAADYDLEHFQGDLRGQGFLYHVDQIYKDQGVNEDGSDKGGAYNALEAAKRILTDPAIKLTERERQAYHSRAVTEVRANEALRKQDIGEARAAASELKMISAYGGKVEPELIEHTAQAFRAAGAPGEAARLYAWASRAHLNDDFGRQPLSEQTRQLEETQGMPRQKAAYDFFIDKGYTPAQASGIIGGLRGETASLNTNQIHDGGIGLGISGWNGPRLAALATFAKENNANPRDLRTQLEFVHHELQTSEKDAGDRLRAAQTPEQAGQAMLGYFRPKDFDVPGAHPERAQYARAAFNVFGGGTPDGSGAIPVGSSTPASSLWLQANHSTVTQKAAREAWGTILSDYDKTGIRPADATINQVVAAARATNDHALLEGVGQGVDRMDLSQAQSRRSLPEQAAAITTLKTAGAEGLLAPGNAGVLKDLQRRNEAITTGLEKNPISTTVTNFSDKFRPLAPLDLANPDSLPGALKMRGQIAQFAQQNWKSKALSALDEADLHQVQTALDTPNVAVKAGIFSAISSLPEEIRNATLAKIGEKRPDLMVSAAAGSMMRQAPDVVGEILLGQQAIKADKEYLPTEKGAAKSMGDDMDKYLPAASFSLQDRTTDNGPYEVARGMVKAYYAASSAHASDTSGEFKAARLKTAIDAVTGGVLYHNSSPLISPVRGISQHQFDGIIGGLTDNDLAGVTTANGQPVTADYLRGSAQLESYGNGRYLVRLGKDPLRPAYAYQGANTEAPQKFILDLRNRPIGPPAYVHEAAAPFVGG